MRKLCALLVFVLPLVAHAGAERAQGRIFAGRLFSQPTEFNALMAPQNLTNFGAIDKTGFEAAYNLFDVVDIGFRLTHNSANNVSSTTGNAMPYYTVIKQDNLQVTAPR